MFQVICAVCDTEQPVRLLILDFCFFDMCLVNILIGLIDIHLTCDQVVRVCTNCGVKMGEYFCEVCKFYDDDVCYYLLVASYIL